MGFNSTFKGLKKGDSLLKHNTPSHGSPSSLCHGAVSPSHTYYKPPLGVFALHSLLLYSDMPPTRPPLFLMGSGNLSQTLSHINTPTTSSRFFFHLTPPTKIKQPECSVTSAHKIQMPRNHPEETIQRSLLSHCACCYIYFIQTNLCTLFNPLAYTDVPETAGLARSINTQPAVRRNAETNPTSQHNRGMY